MRAAEGIDQVRRTAPPVPVVALAILGAALALAGALFSQW